MHGYYPKILSALLLLGGFSFSGSSVRAQIATDGTLSTTVTSSGTTFTITDGDLIGNNLFHSFDEFSIPTNGAAIFDNGTDIENIFSRVTGRNLSDIDGLIQANANASLFLLNPNGIVFGPNAALDLGGSFLATTADRLVFDNGFEFSASDPQPPPLLTVNTPTGLQFGLGAAEIVNRAQAVDASSGALVGLQVAADQAITLVGGLILMENGHLTTSGGAIELGSVAPDSVVDIDPNTQALSYRQVEVFQDIFLTQGTKVNASGDGGGRVQVQGARIQLTDRARIVSNTLGAENGNGITLTASEQIEMQGRTVSGEFSGIEANVEATGNGSAIEVTTPQLDILNGAGIESSINGAGRGGDITITATVIGLSGLSPVLRPSIIASRTFGQGPSGNIDIDTQTLISDSAFISTVAVNNGDAGDIAISGETLRFLNGSQVQTGAFSGAGNGGDLVIQASNELELIGITPYTVVNSRPSTDDEGDRGSTGLFASVNPDSSGDSGNILVETGKLRIADGGKIATNTVGQGDGGNITIRATDIEVSDAFIDFVGGLSGIIATVGEQAQGEGGDISIEANLLRVFDGGQINAATLGMGNAGNIYIDADRLEVIGESNDGQFSSSISASASSNFAAGSVEISADNVRIGDDGEIVVSSSGQGDAGNLEIVANRLILDTEARLQADVNGGAQGNIDLFLSDALVLRRGGRITTNATSGSVGGNINIAEGFIVGISGENSDISANSDASFGGRISLTTKGILGLQIREQLTPLSDITASSELGTEFGGDVEVNNLTVNPALALVELPSVLADTDDQIATACASSSGNQFTASGRGGVPISPTEFLPSIYPWVDRRLSHSGASELNAATARNTIEVAAEPEVIEASGWHINQDGRVELVTSAIVASNLVPTCLIQASAG